jgi:hypothetical protein
MEWPDGEAGRMFHAWQQCDYSFHDYVRLFEAKERGVKVFRRWIDRDFASQRRQRGTGLTSILDELRRESRGNLRLQPHLGDFSNNHALVQAHLRPRAHVGLDGRQTSGPTLLVHADCANFDYAMRRYRFDKNSGRGLDANDRLKSRPQERHKCFPNTVEMLAGGAARWVDPAEWLMDLDEVENEAFYEGLATGTDSARGRTWSGYGY